METADATRTVIETKGVVLSDVAGESTPKSKRESSPVPPLPPHRHRDRGFAPVFEDVIEVYTPGGERMEFDTKDITTVDLKRLVALKRGVPLSQVQLFSGQTQVTDETPIMVGQLNVVFKCALEPECFPTFA